MPKKQIQWFFLELGKHWEHLLATTKLVYLIFDAWRQGKVLKYPSIWLVLSVAFEMFIDIVANNIDTWEERGSLARRKHAVLSDKLVRKAVALPDPDTPQEALRLWGGEKCFWKTQMPASHSRPTESESRRGWGRGAGSKLLLFWNFQGWLRQRASVENDGGRAGLKPTVCGWISVLMLPAAQKAKGPGFSGFRFPPPMMQHNTVLTTWWHCKG